MRPIRVARAARVAFVLGLVASCSSTTTLATGSPTPAPTTTPPPATAVPTPEPTEPAAVPSPQPRTPTLVDECSGGSDRACDILYFLTDPGTPEEALALDCAGRRPERPEFCTPGIELSSDFWASTSSDGMPAVVDDCLAGDWTACDFLYYLSPPGSRNEELGRTCGDRVTTAIPDCRRMFGR